MADFFQTDYREVIPSPNGGKWWHNMPLPDGTRINGVTDDKNFNLKSWDALQIPKVGGLTGKSVLDIGANDGFYTLAALAAGARKATAINSADWSEYPGNIRLASQAWGLNPQIITADFRTYPFRERFDVIFFFGVLYHLEDVFSCMKLLRDLLEENGVLYLETQMTSIECDRPIFESASDIYKTTTIQYKQGLSSVGICNYLLPNELAIKNLAYMYDFDVENLCGPHNLITQVEPNRWYFKMVKKTV